VIARLTVIALVVIAAYFIGRIQGYAEGYRRVGWCGACLSYHGDRDKCQELPDWM
jgi:hypothetical protein